MSFTSLPIEIITQTFDLLDESEPEKPYQVVKRKEVRKTPMALRLTCRAFGEVATRPLFRTFCLSPSWESWKKLDRIAANKKLRAHIQIMAVKDYHEPLEDFNFAP